MTFDRNALPKIDFFKKDLYLYFIYLLFFLLVLSPTYIFSYALSDDWILIQAIYNNLTTSIIDWDVKSGRPLYGLFKVIITTSLNNLGDLRYTRFVSVLAIWILCCLFYKMISNRKILENKYQKILFPFILCLLPSFQVYASWAICSPYVLSVLLSLLSYCCLIDSNGNTNICKFFISLILLCISFSIYQPAAMCFLFFVFFDNCVREKDFNLKNLITCAIVISISMLFSFFISKLVPQFLYDDLINRTNLTSEFLKKTLWFFHQPLMNSIANYNINPGFFYKIISIIIVIIGLYSIYNKKHGGKKLLLTLLLAVSSYVPNLVVEESWAAYRSLVSLELIMTSVFIIGIFYISDKFKINHVTYPTIIILVMFFSFKNILKGFVIPQIVEFRLLYNEIAKNVPQDFSGNLLFNVKNSENKTFSDISDNTLIGYDEFGQTSMIIPFATPGMAEEIKSERKMSYKYAGSITNTENIKCDENCIIIDVTKIIEQNKSLK